MTSLGGMGRVLGQRGILRAVVRKLPLAGGRLPAEDAEEDPWDSPEGDGSQATAQHSTPLDFWSSVLPVCWGD